MTEKHSHRGLVVAAIMASMAMIAVEVTIVSTAMPQIAAQLGQLNLYSWVFSSFLLTQTATTVVFGKRPPSLFRRTVGARCARSGRQKVEQGDQGGRWLCRSQNARTLRHRRAEEPDRRQ